MALRILIDTNVLLDYLLKREPYEQAAQKIVVACKNGQASGCIAAHSISNMFYILRKMTRESAQSESSPCIDLLKVEY